MVQQKHSIQKSQLLVNVELQQLKRFGYLNDIFVFDDDDFDFQKGGFGAQKVTTDFKEIERNVQEQEKFREQQAHLEIKNREETAKQVEKQM